MVEQLEARRLLSGAFIGLAGLELGSEELKGLGHDAKGFAYVFANLEFPRLLDPRPRHQYVLDPSTAPGGAFVIKYSARGKLMWAKPMGAMINLTAVGPDGSTYTADDSGGSIRV